uniref:Matrilin-1 n=1 Tax=Mastacembelus armatus TaxID=205130 RepID=A0A3Q3M771_9TELE
MVGSQRTSRIHGVTCTVSKPHISILSALQLTLSVSGLLETTSHPPLQPCLSLHSSSEGTTGPHMQTASAHLTPKHTPPPAAPPLSSPLCPPCGPHTSERRALQAKLLPCCLLRTICRRFRTAAFSDPPSVAAMMLTPPLFLLLLGLVGAQATFDLRTAAATAAGLCQTRPTDLIFIIDSSRSVRPSEFEQVKVFLAKVIEGLDVGPNATRVGVVNYASRVKNEVSLKTHRTKAGLIKAVTKIEPLSTGTMTGLAIQFALNVAFSEGEGARVKSPGISKVAIIVTDGRPQDNVKDVAQRARDAGIEIFAIGVGRVDMSTLRQMASDPLDDHVDYVESYSVIEKLTKKFQEAFCVSDLCASGDHDCQQVCISTPGSYKCACKPGFTLMDNGRTCSACSNSATDVVFLIDGSKSIRPENFELVKKWINQIIDKLDVSHNNAHVGLVQYSSSVKQEFPLGLYNNRKDLKDAVKKMAYMEKGTMTGQALRYLLDNSFTPNQGARPGVTKVAIVFTDGRSQDYIGDAAKKAKEHGYRMYAVGVGSAVEDELKEIASEPIGEHYFYTADFKAMSQIAKKLRIDICQEEDPCECDSLVKFQKKVEEALQALTKKNILYNV